MKITLDTDNHRLRIEDSGASRELGLYTSEAFEILSHWWTKVGWALKYPYGFTWMGRPIIQLPEDMVRVQEVAYRVRPDVIVETGVAHGGSLIFFASLCKAMGRGRVIGIDIEIRPKNRAAIETHDLGSLITLVEGSSVAPEVVERVRASIAPDQRVLVILDSDHSAAHVEAELECYAPLVAPGSYIVATDGVMRDLHDAPRGKPEWRTDNPCTAVEKFLTRHPEFVLESPPRVFDESETPVSVTHWPNAYLRRV